ncbi:MAG: polyprenyl synthetase family protein [Clostridia bacterium]|nr:polyprenyl synthetase family protein [Clostridia bacterium]
MNYRVQYEIYRKAVEETLEKAVPDAVPEPLASAMRYSLLAGGKRLRPVLLLAAYQMVRSDLESALPFAAAVEMVHTYSLIHDDLPAMDNDDLRRGKPTCHRVYGDGMAVLAGDGLLSLAFETMAESGHPRAFDAMRELALRCGCRGMVAGQCADLTAEKNGGGPELLSYIHRHKTADLLSAPMVMGFLLSQAEEKLIEAGREYGYNLGLAFQIVDDMLDVTGTVEKMGKSIGKDAEENKCTWVSVYGLEQAGKDASHYTSLAVRALEPWHEKAGFLQTLAQNVLTRVQ